MRFRTLALALALGCAMTGMAEAKRKPAVHKVSVKKSKGYKTNRANKVKPRKAKRVKSRRPNK
ncbi:exported hypothetical protein [Candidatus Sulfopaludibacter sp. SbA6]|nr:exported hypothetical protein [Candidatus Sulfopaludibacter sp. SbA6]